MKRLFLVAALLVFGASFAQTVNDYKYVVIPQRFESQREAGEFELNSLVKSMLEKYGFTVYMEKDELPKDLLLDKCKAMYADLLRDGGLLRTGITIKLNDCKGNSVFTSLRGVSKQKDLKRACYEALREASVSFNDLNYKYKGDDTVVVSTPVTKTETVTVYVPSTATEAKATVNDKTLFAQPISNGYQLVDTTPKVVLKMYKTSQPDSFTAVGEGKNGVVFKKGNDWFFEYYQNDELISEKLDIKF